ncbi:MAG: NAD-dependent epimerase/dehydratase family protein [Persicimonas sp.]
MKWDDFSQKARAMTEEQLTMTGLEPGTQILVTGAAGGVGRHVVRAALDAGLKVRAVDRIGAAEADMHGLFDPSEDVDWWFAELSAADLDGLVAGCEAVVHTAALVSLSESYAELAPVNVGLVRSLYQACERQGASHFVHFSCGSVYEPQSGVREEGDHVRASNAYEQTKIDSEEALPDAPDSVRWTVLRPALIYGPHCSKMGAGIVTIPPIVRGFTPYLPGMTGGSRTNWCYVEDAASAAMCVLGRDEAYEQIFNVADATPLGFGEVVTVVTEAYGLEVGPLVPFPNTALWKALSPVIDRDVIFDLARQILRGLWNRLQQQHDLDSPLRPRVDRNALFYVEKDNILGTDRLQALGWRPRYVDFREGIVESIRWYQAHGWAPRYDTETRYRIRDEKQNIGFGFREMLEGEWSDASGRRGKAHLVLDAEFPHVARLALALEGNIDGTLVLEGLADHVEVRGTIRVRLLAGDGLHYEMGFDDDQGRPHRLELTRRVRTLHPLESLTHLDGQLVGPDTQTAGEVELNFDLRSQLVPTVASLRIVH